MTVHYFARGDWDFSGLPRMGYQVDPKQFTGLAVHHTVTYFDPDDFDPAGEIIAVKNHMRRLQNERPDLGLDVPYSWVVFEHQNAGDSYVCEGRGPGRTGAHTYGYNSTRYGVAVVGNFVNQVPTQGIIDGINYVGYHYCPWATSPTQGHGSFPQNATACPGNNLNSRLGEMQPPFKPSEPTVIEKPNGLDDDDMLRMLIDESGTVYAVDGLQATPISSQYTVTVLTAAGTLMTKEQMIKAGYQWNIDRASIAAAYQILDINEKVPDKAF